MTHSPPSGTPSDPPTVVPLMLADERIRPSERGWFILGFEAATLLSTVANFPDLRARWPIHEPNRLRVTNACTALRRRVTFGEIPGRPGVWLADVRPLGWKPEDDDIAESAGTDRIDGEIAAGGGVDGDGDGDDGLEASE